MSKKRTRSKDKKVINIKNNLMYQVEKIFKQCNNNAFKTRHTYLNVVEHFCEWVGEKYRLQKFKNVKEKHIEAYTEYLKEQGYSAAYIMKILSGIRFFHSRSGSDYALSEDNKAFDLEKRIEGGVERAWSQEEIEKAVALAKADGREDIALIIRLCDGFGLRIEEAVTLTTNQVYRATTTSNLSITGKHGLTRQLTLSNLLQFELLHEALKDAPRGGKIFINGSKKTHLVIQEVKDYIYRNRDKFQDADRLGVEEIKKAKKGGKVERAKLSAHGLRHSYAVRRLKETGSLKKTSEEIGHFRPQITKTYVRVKRR